jgi:hypothetical protein
MSNFYPDPDVDGALSEHAPFEGVPELVIDELRDHAERLNSLEMIRDEQEARLADLEAILAARAAHDPKPSLFRRSLRLFVR